METPVIATKKPICFRDVPEKAFFILVKDLFNNIGTMVPALVYTKATLPIEKNQCSVSTPCALSICDDEDGEGHFEQVVLPDDEPVVIIAQS